MHGFAIPAFESFEALNAYLLHRRRMADCLRDHDETIGERLKRDLAALQASLPAAYDACEKLATTVSRRAPNRNPRQSQPPRAPKSVANGRR